MSNLTPDPSVPQYANTSPVAGGTSEDLLSTLNTDPEDENLLFIDPSQYPEEEVLREKIKDIRMYGRISDGFKPNFISKIAWPYTRNGGHPIHEGKYAGVTYSIEPISNNKDMPSGRDAADNFIYTITGNGTERCKMDNVFVAAYHLMGPDDERTVPNGGSIHYLGNDIRVGGIADIIRAINPHSKLLAPLK